MSVELDLGHGHVLRFMRWAPDDLPANRARWGYPLPVIERLGATICHPPKVRQAWFEPDQECVGAVYFDSPDARRAFPGRAFWTVDSWDPLTLSPSILCICGDHGFIRGGKWVPA